MRKNEHIVMVGCLSMLFGGSIQVFASGKDSVALLGRSNRASETLEQQIEKLRRFIGNPFTPVEEIIAVLRQVPQEQWEIVLKIANENGDTLFHWAARFGNGRVLVRTLADHLSGDQLVRFLKVRNGNGNTSFDWVINSPLESGIEFLKVVVSKLSPQQLVEFLAFDDPLEDEPLLHKVVSSRNGGVLIRLLAEKLSKPLFINLLKTPGEEGCTIFHEIVQAYRGGACLRTMAEVLRSADLINLLQITDRFGQTPFHRAVDVEGGEVFLSAVEEVLPGQLTGLLSIPARWGLTPLHYAAISPYGVEILETLVGIIGEQLAELLDIPNEEGLTPRQMAVRSQNSGEFVRTIDTFLSSLVLKDKRRQRRYTL